MRNRLMKSLESIQGCVNRLYHSLLVTTPSPVSPSPWQGEGELIERGASPLLYTPFFTVSSSPLLEESFRGTQSLFSKFPLSFEGEGDKGGEVENMGSVLKNYKYLRSMFSYEFIASQKEDSFLYRLLADEDRRADVWRQEIDNCLELAYRYNLVDPDLEGRLYKGDWEIWEAYMNELRVAKFIEQIIGVNCLHWRPPGKKRRIGEFEISLEESDTYIFCEVKTVLPRDLEKLEQRVHDKLRNCIKEIALPFAVIIHLENAGGIENFSERFLKSFLEEELIKLDTQDKDKVYELPDYRDKTGLHLKINASPSKKFKNCYLGACSFNARWGSSEVYVKHSLGKAYTKLDGTKPSLVILCPSPNYLIDEHDMLNAWLGTETVVITYGEDGAAINTDVTRKPNGFCLKRPKISAASIYKDNIVNEQAEILHNLEIYHNPLATIPIDESIFKGRGVKQLVRKNDREMEWIN